MGVWMELCFQDYCKSLYYIGLQKTWSGSLISPKAGTLAKILGILPAWMTGAGVGCAIGCEIFG
jgi:hypothetical protein